MKVSFSPWTGTNFSVSIGVEYRGETIVGVVYAPYLDECFYAVKGEGAYLNGKRITPGNKTSLRQAVVATGFPVDKDTTPDNNLDNFIRDHGAEPTFKGFPNPYGSPFPASICTSVNEVVVHGIPDDTPLRDGDIVSVDCGTHLNGFCGDSCYTFCVGEVKPEVRELLRVTKESLYKGIEQSSSATAQLPPRPSHGHSRHPPRQPRPAGGSR